MGNLMLQAKPEAISSPVININEFPGIVPILLPDGFNHIHRLYDVHEMSPKWVAVESFQDKFTSKQPTPWIDVKSLDLNLAPGYHKYRLSFIDICTNDTTYLYFAYQVQTDAPDKPYLYMERSDDE